MVGEGVIVWFLGLAVGGGVRTFRELLSGF